MSSIYDDSSEPSNTNLDEINDNNIDEKSSENKGKYNLNDFSIKNIINSNYKVEDYIEALITALGILILVYVLLMSRDEPALLTALIFAIVFSFLIVIQNKYKNQYETKLNTVKNELGTIKQKMLNNIDNIIDEDDYS
jgi:hypothetical protein